MIHWFWWYWFWLTVMSSLLVVEERKKLSLQAQKTCQGRTMIFTHSQKRSETETESFVMASQRMQFGIFWWFRRYFWITPNQLLLKPAVTVHPAAESLQLLLCRKLLSEGVQHCCSFTLTLRFCNAQRLIHIPGKKASNLLSLLQYV